MKRKLSVVLALILAVTCFIGCQKSEPSPGDKEGYDSGEEYLAIWVHTIEDTDEGRCYKEAVQKFNEEYNGKYFADIEFIPRNDSGGGYSDKINASVMSGGLPDVITVDGPNIAAFSDGSKITLPQEIAEKLTGHQGELILGIRGEDIKFDSQSIDAYGSSKQQAVIDNTEIMGNENNLYFQFSGAQTVARVSKYEVCQIGDKVEFVFMPHKMHFFDKETEKAI